MKIVRQSLIITIVAGTALALAACTQTPTREATGTVLGGAAGGIIGSQIGGGRGQMAATIAGTLAGAAIGGAIGRTMDDVDRMRVQQTLESAPDNEPREWRNPNTGHRYEATPKRTYERDGQPCREYEVLATIDGEAEKITGTACRDVYGNWVMQ